MNALHIALAVVTGLVGLWFSFLAIEKAADYTVSPRHNADAKAVGLIVTFILLVGATVYGVLEIVYWR
jgi:hypothetical protein